MTGNPRKNVYFAPHVLRHLETSDDSLSGRTNTVVDRYYEALHRAGAIETLLNPSDLAAIAETCAHVPLEPAAQVFRIADELRRAGMGRLADKVAALSAFDQVRLAEWLDEQRD